MPAKWFERLFEKAARGELCARFECTTCGSREFRSGVIMGAMADGGISLDPPLPDWPVDLVKVLTHDERQRVFDTILRELRLVASEPEWRGPLKVILHDLDPPLVMWGIAANFPKLLDGTFAGEVLTAMRERSIAVAECQEQLQSYESPESVADRRRVKALATAERVRQLTEKKTLRDRERLETLDELRRLDPHERLHWIANLLQTSSSTRFLMNSFQ